ncbi:hypothetical protein [Candidatus Endomicrobiellum devescovinae]|jgi:hypothetical protein|uniref:hypothetical protein n=1 Tax=Candidatus Endomicrobiellum devescovinae TaxID=3242322 RepID=UPI002839F76B|nr:hypothetical protein [Endomicrobium sp.]
MNTKRAFFAGMLLFLSLTSFSAESRHIVFFAETSDISSVVIDKIALSNRFCMVVPQDSRASITESLEELISVGKIELALSLDPEPILPLLAEVSNANFKKKYNKNGIFENYISDNLSLFVNNSNKENFGMFLSSAKMSHELLYYFSDLGLYWVNVDNIEGNVCGAYYVDGIAAFSLYKSFPYSQQEVMKWLESKSEEIIPVLLTKKHLQNVKFMEYIIRLFDASKYIKPATPLYIAKVKNNMLQQKDIFFEKVILNPDIDEKLQSAAKSLSNYADSSSFSKTIYSNAQNELVYLCGQDVLNGVSSDSISGRRMFDAAYNNIYRLLGLQTKGLQDSKNIDKQTAPSVDMQNTANASSVQTSVEIISGGVSIYNEGLLRLVQIASKGNVIKINLSFNGVGWNEEVSFVDFYIDLNGISGMGGSSFIYGVSGFLVADSGWEYALRIYKDKAILYKYSVDGASIISNLAVNDNSVSIPTKYIRGNPVKWGFQAIVVSENMGKKTIVDFLNQTSKSKYEILSLKPFQAPLVRR